jgi:hypothetical protein
MAEQPSGTGTLVFARWDFLGVGQCDHDHPVEDEAASIKVETTHAYTEPGTYFASFRIGGHREGKKGRGQPIENLARVRVVVRAS